MKEKKFSSFMLERFRLGELNKEDTKIIIEGLARDRNLLDFLQKLDESDRELRLRYPYESMGLPVRPFKVRNFPKTNGRLALLAAALILCIFLPMGFLWRNALGDSTQDRAKGIFLPGIEFALYLRGSHEAPLPEKALLYEGDMVQLAYTAPDGEHYGVIFSIDGRSVVTMHYPYRRGQSSLLISGRRTYLNAAYVLDDAPDFELFVMVVSPEPLDAEVVILEAQRITDKAVSPEPLQVMGFIEDEIRAAFKDYEVETLRMLKRDLN